MWEDSRIDTILLSAKAIQESVVENQILEEGTREKSAMYTPIMGEELPPTKMTLKGPRVPKNFQTKS